MLRGSLHALPWNLIGFIVPGILLAMAGGAIAASVDAKPRRTVAFWLFVISGLGFAGTGLSPAEMENGVALVTSPFTKGHFIMSLIHGIVQRIAGAIYFAWFVVMSVRLIRIDRDHFQVTGG